MLTEAQRPRRGARQHRDPRRGDGVAGAGAGRPLRSRAPPGRRLRRAARSAERTAQPFMLHVAEHYGSAIALCDGRLDGRRGAGPALARVGPAADRARLLGRPRDPDVQRPPRAGAAGRARPGDPAAGRRPARDGPWRPGLVALLAELGMEAEARRELARLTADGLDAVPRVALARLARVPDRRVRGARRREPSRRWSTPSSSRSRRQRDDRPPGRLLRRGRPLPRHARGDARRGRARGGALRARHGPEPAHGRRDLARAHRVRVRALPARAAAGPAGARRALLGEAASLAERIGMPALQARIRALGAPAPAPGLPDGLSPREAQILGPRGPGPQQPPGRQQRCRSASTRPRTTSAASCARPAAPTAPRPPPTPTGTGWRLTEHLVGSERDAALHDRAHVRRPARPHERRHRR